MKTPSSLSLFVYQRDQLHCFCCICRVLQEKGVSVWWCVHKKCGGVILCVMKNSCESDKNRPVNRSSVSINAI